MNRFEVNRVQVDIAGPQAYVIEGHISTRSGKPAEVLDVSMGQMMIYLYDLDAARAFAVAWRSALRFVPADLPARADEREPRSREASHVGLLLQVEGAPGQQRVNGIPAGASLSGRSHVRVGRLIVHAQDLVSVETTAAAWATVEEVAERLWPDLDAFGEAEARARLRIARTGRADARPTPDRAR